MIRVAITVSLVPEARGGPFVFRDDLPAACAAAAEMGFDAIELFPPDAAAIRPADLRRVLEDHRLKLAAVGTGGGWVRHRLSLSLPDARARAAARDFVRSIIDFAGPLGAPAIIGSMQGRSDGQVDRPTAIAYLGEALDQLGEHARQYRVPLIYEPLNRYETDLANTVDAGVRILDALSTKNVKLLADLFHMNIEEADVGAAIRAGGGRLGHVHFADSNRRAPGMGHTDFAPIVAALRQIEYGGYLSAEILPLPDPHAAARQTMQAYRQLVLNR